jgi:hypothetical protein
MSNLIEKSELRKIAAVAFLEEMEKEAAKGTGVIQAIKNSTSSTKGKAKEVYKGLRGRKLPKNKKGLVTKSQGDAMVARDKYRNKGLKARKHLKNNKKKYIVGGAAGAGGTGYALGSEDNE